MQQVQPRLDTKGIVAEHTPLGGRGTRHARKIIIPVKFRQYLADPIPRKARSVEPFRCRHG